MLIAVQILLGNGLALSVCCADTSPKGRGFGRPEGAKNPLSEMAALRPASYLIQWHYYRDDSPKISVYQVIQSVHIDTVRQCISKVIVSS